MKTATEVNDFQESQERFQLLWLSQRPEWPQKCRCVWQDTRGIPGTMTTCLELWLVGNELYMIQFMAGGGFEVYKREDK